MLVAARKLRRGVFSSGNTRRRNSILAKTITRFTATRTFVYRNQLSRLYIELLFFIDSPFVVVVLAHDVTASGLFLFERQNVSH